MFKVIDHFLKNPDQIRQRALQCSYAKRSADFPGFSTTRSILIPEFDEKIRKLLPDTARKPQRKGRFQYYVKSHRKNYIHTDPGYEWMAILFLCPVKGEFPGTTFYKHNATGLRRIPIRDPRWRLEHLTRHPKADPRILEVERDRYRYDAWTPVRTLSAKYNRLLLFRSDYFHMGASGWGTRPENSRLCYVFSVK